MINEKKEFVIRQSRKKQWSFVLLTVFLLLWYFFGPYEKTRIIYKQSPGLTIVLGLVFFGLLFYFLSELIRRKAEIILTTEGIELRDKGFYKWGMIESFSTLTYRYSKSHTIDLILHFKEFADLKFDISALEKNETELADLIIRYKGSESMYFAGHKIK